MNMKQIIWMFYGFVLLRIQMVFGRIFFRGEKVKVGFPGLRERVFVRKRGSDQSVFGWIFIMENYAMPFFEGFSPNVIIDAGAYTGYSTVFFATKYPDAVIVAIEPESSNFDILKKNTANYPNVHCIQAALWSNKTNVQVMNNPTGRQWSFRVEEAKGDASVLGKPVPTVTIPELMKQFGFSVIDLLKIDIEGAEKKLFSENYELWIGKCGVIAIELHERFAPGCSKAFYSALSRLSFGQYIRRGNVFVDIRNTS